MRFIALALTLLLSSIAYGEAESCDESLSVTECPAPPDAGLYFDTQFLWFDSPIYERLGGVSDDGQEFAPRFILGYDAPVGARVRWWTYDRGVVINSVPIGPDDMRLQFDVVDIEATTHLRYGASDFLLSGGARIAAVESDEHYINQNVSKWEKTTMPGITFAAEGRTNIYSRDSWGTAFVYGGRLSLLKADWTGDFVDQSVVPLLNIQNERFIVPEVFTGIEVHYGSMITRLNIEMQDWRGTVPRRVGIVNSGEHNFAFTGFGFDVGYCF